jgi:glutathione S-transferase
MTLRIYGTAASRAARPLWVAQELGLDYQHIDLPYLGGATRTPEFLKVNPNGRIPVVDDDGVLVWESMACSMYLAERFLGQDDLSLAARTHAERAEILRWTFWVVTECEKDALQFLMHARLMPPERRKPQLAEESLRHLTAPLRILDRHLQDRTWLAGERFTVADVCVASVLAWVESATDLMDPSPQAGDWLRRCLARPAYQAVRSMAENA